MKYSEAYDKIIQAYFKDEIKPANATFCFCGTLSGGSGWKQEFEEIVEPYTYNEYGKMEKALFSAWPNIIQISPGHVPSALHVINRSRRLPDFEDKLFEGMCAALEVLKQIHISRGEVIDETPSFTKRQLAIK
jgi:hypothetical protein